MEPHFGVISSPPVLVVKSNQHPSYLKYFEDKPVTLIWVKKVSCASNSGDPFIKVDTHDEDASAFIGSPLKVDLGDDIVVEREVFCERDIQPSWAPEELKHYSMSVQLARNELNKVLSNKKSEKESIYIVCNGDDSKKTVLLGANYDGFITSSIHVFDKVVAERAECLIEKLMQADFENPLQATFLTKMSFYLYGSNLQHSQNQSSIDGSIVVDISTPNKIFKVQNLQKADVKLSATIVAGHLSLKLNSWWKELCQLQQLVNILSEGNFNDKVLISHSPLGNEKIFGKLAEFVKENWIKLTPIKDAIDLDNLRSLDMLDRLWNLLLGCENLASLKESLNFLFEELANGNCNVLPSSEDTSGIYSIIYGIAHGQIRLPNMSLKDCVVALFELGARKLFADFQTILAEAQCSTINAIWKSFNRKNTKSIRATRVVSKLGDSYDTSLFHRQLGYLGQLYLASELLCLVKSEVKLPSEAVKGLHQALEKKYISTSSYVISFIDILNNPVHDLCFNIKLNSLVFLEGKLPSRYTLSMTIGSRTNVYHLSSSPIFPPAIYNEYDIISEENGPVYYVTKMNRSSFSL